MQFVLIRVTPNFSLKFPVDVIESILMIRICIYRLFMILANTKIGNIFIDNNASPAIDLSPRKLMCLQHLALACIARRKEGENDYIYQIEWFHLIPYNRPYQIFMRGH